MKTKDLMSKTETGCCPRFDAKQWKDKEITWKDKLFVKARIRSVFHIPLNIGSVMKRTAEMIDAADAANPDFLGLFDENSLWGADVYMSATKNVPGAQMAKISGTFLTKIFEGPYSNAYKWMKEMVSYVDKKGKTAKKLYNYYVYCPKCAKHYGKTYTVILAQVA